MKKLVKVFVIGVIVTSMMSCASDEDSGDDGKQNVEDTEQSEASVSDDPMDNKGIGPISSVELGAVDADMAALGAENFDNLCSACHKMEKRFVGPSLAGVLDRRSPEWVMNMILNPEQMVNEDPIAKDLLAEYLAPMANQNLTEDQARSILEYFRSYTPEQTN